jgi:hypothetical protein
LPWPPSRSPLPRWPVATLMLEDLEGWAWLLRAKVMDP